MEKTPKRPKESGEQRTGYLGLGLAVGGKEGDQWRSQIQRRFQRMRQRVGGPNDNGVGVAPGRRVKGNGVGRRGRGSAQVRGPLGKVFGGHEITNMLIFLSGDMSG